VDRRRRRGKEGGRGGRGGEGGGGQTTKDESQEEWRGRGRGKYPQ